MKKGILLILGALLSAGPLSAQDVTVSVPGDGAEQVLFDPGYQDIAIVETYGVEPFDMFGYRIYGSRYRKAKSNLGLGTTLVSMSIPLGLAFAVWGSTVNGDGSQEAVAAVGAAAVLGAGLGFGIPLIRKGRREMDWMLDDYARRYAPKPYSSSLDIGATGNGVGLAFRF